MTQIAPSQARAIEMLLADLPADKVQELIDFAQFLKERYAPQAARGSAAAILQGLQEVGPLEFEPDELDTLLDDLEAMRQLDMRNNG